MPSPHAPTALVALLVLAGCSGIPAPTESSPQADGLTAAPTTGSTTIPPDRVVAYEDLPADTRLTFRRAVENGSVVRDADAFDGLSPEADEYVRFDGTTYSLEWNTMYVRAEYGLAEVEPANGSAPDPDGAVVAYSNLSETARDVFDRARNGSETRMYGARAFPEPFLEHRYVEHRDRRYRILVVHADVPQWELRVDEVHAGANG